MTILNTTLNPINAQERVKINENWDRIMQRFSSLQNQINILSGETSVEDVLNALNAAISNANSTVQGLVDTSNQSIANVNQKINEVDDKLVELQTAIDNADLATNATNSAISDARQAIADINAYFENFRFVGEYNATTTYYNFNFVRYKKSTFVSLKENLGITPNDDGINWRLVAAGGIDGMGTVVSVNGKNPDPNGDVTLEPFDIGSASSEQINETNNNLSTLQQQVTTYFDEKVDKGTLVINVKDFGAIGDGATDDTQAFFNAINSNPMAKGFTLYVPNGRYIIKDTIYVTRRIQIEGDGIDATVLDFSQITNVVNNPYSSAIIFVHQGNTVGGIQNPTNPINLPSGQVGNYGLNASINRLSVLGSKTKIGVHGIFINCPMQLNVVQVESFAGHGIVIGATDTFNGLEIKGNANHVHLNYPFAYLNGKSGIYITGSDANTFLINQGVTIGNDEWGIYDNSLLGGTVIGSESDSNAQGAYGGTKIRPTRTIWVGCYAEEGTQPIHYDVSGRNLILGATGAQPQEGQSYLGGVVDVGLVAYRPLNIAATDQSAYDLGGTTGTASRLSKNILEIRPHIGKDLLTYGADINNANYGIINVGNKSSIKFPLTDVSGVVQKGVPYFENGLSLSTEVKMSASTVMPTSGFYYKGEIVWNDFPSILGTAGSNYIVNGWRRMTSGEGHVLNSDWVEMRTLTGM